MPSGGADPIGGLRQALLTVWVTPQGVVGPVSGLLSAAALPAVGLLSAVVLVSGFRTLLRRRFSHLGYWVSWGVSYSGARYFPDGVIHPTLPSLVSFGVQPRKRIWFRYGSRYRR